MSGDVILGDLVDRVQALEDKGIMLNDLPLRALRNALIENGDPIDGRFLLPSSIGSGQIAATSIFQLTPITAVTVASPGNGNIAWTTLDVSAQAPVGATYALLRVLIGGSLAAASGSYLSNSVDFRKDASSPICATVRVDVIGAISTGTRITEQVLVPLPALRTFQYQKTDAINGSSGATIEIIGYVA